MNEYLKLKNKEKVGENAWVREITAMKGEEPCGLSGNRVFLRFHQSPICPTMLMTQGIRIYPINAH